MDRDVGAHIPRAVAGAQVLDAEDPAGDEASEGDDRHRHVEVEDLLDEALVRLDRGVEENEREGGSDRDRRSDREGAQALSVQGRLSSVLQQVVEDRDRDQHERHIVEAE